MSEAGFKRGRSAQDFETPPDFMRGVVKRFGQPTFDLAASVRNTKAPCFFDEQENALAQQWYKIKGLLWLNPPFASITPWAAKCADEATQGAKILLLVPASVGSNWFRDHVFNQARVLFLNGRLTFVGCPTSYPKDCMLCSYGDEPGCEIWKWNK